MTGLTTCPQAFSYPKQVENRRAAACTFTVAFGVPLISADDLPIESVRGAALANSVPH